VGVGVGLLWVTLPTPEAGRVGEFVIPLLMAGREARVGAQEGREGEFLISIILQLEDTAMFGLHRGAWVLAHLSFFLAYL